MLLDRWYADFNVTFTYEKPTRGRFYTVVVTSAGTTWCGADFPPGVAGVAPVRSDCGDKRSGVAYAFVCGKDAKSCASVIAQEQAHLVGLQHTQSVVDVMCPIAVAEVSGFEESPSSPWSRIRMPPPCPSTQNSYRLMLQRFGNAAGDAVGDARSGDLTSAARLATVSAEVRDARPAQRRNA